MVPPMNISHNDIRLIPLGELTDQLMRYEYAENSYYYNRETNPLSRTNLCNYGPTDEPMRNEAPQDDGRHDDHAHGAHTQDTENSGTIPTTIVHRVNDGNDILNHTEMVSNEADGEQTPSDNSLISAAEITRTSGHARDNPAG